MSILLRDRNAPLSLLLAVLFLSFAARFGASIGSKSPGGGGEAYVTLLYGDEFLLGVRVLGKSIRDTGTTKDMVVLVSDGVSDYACKLLRVRPFIPLCRQWIRIINFLVSCCLIKFLFLATCATLLSPWVWISPLNREGKIKTLIVMKMIIYCKLTIWLISPTPTGKLRCSDLRVGWQYIYKFVITTSADEFVGL